MLTHPNKSIISLKKSYNMHVGCDLSRFNVEWGKIFILYLYQYVALYLVAFED